MVITIINIGTFQGLDFSGYQEALEFLRLPKLAHRQLVDTFLIGKLHCSKYIYIYKERKFCIFLFSNQYFYNQFALSLSISISISIRCCYTEFRSKW